MRVAPLKSTRKFVDEHGQCHLPLHRRYSNLWDNNIFYRLVLPMMRGTYPCRILDTNLEVGMIYSDKVAGFSYQIAIGGIPDVPTLVLTLSGARGISQRHNLYSARLTTISASEEISELEGLSFTENKFETHPPCSQFFNAYRHILPDLLDIIHRFKVTNYRNRGDPRPDQDPGELFRFSHETSDDTYMSVTPSRDECQAAEMNPHRTNLNSRWQEIQQWPCNSDQILTSISDEYLGF